MSSAKASDKVPNLDDFQNMDLDSKIPRNEYHFTTPVLVSALSKFLKDQRDVPIVCLQANIFIYLPLAVAFVYYVNLVEPSYSVLVRSAIGITYLVVLVLLFFERFFLMLHFSSHRSIYHVDLLNAVPNWILAPFFGVPPGMYKLHHVTMHHLENNHNMDISSTEFYQRDSWAAFLRYWLRFVFLIGFELPIYSFRTKRYQQCQTATSALILWWGSMILLARFVSFQATLWTLILPHYLAMSAMAFGNWAQHMFINPMNPESNYGLTYNCLDSPTNRTTFNDGYHVVHHLNGRLHWTELPTAFYEKKEEHFKSGAITFRNIHFFDVGILVMTKQLRKLAEHYVHLGPPDKAPTIEAVEECLRARLKPIAPIKSASSKKL